MTTFTIPAVPVAKGRPKMSTRGGFARAYTPKKTREYEEMVGLVARTHFPVPMIGPLYVRAEFYFEHPKSSWRKRTPWPQTWKLTKPDVDNLLKALLDGLCGEAFLDDSQCVWVVARKYCCAQGGPARTVVTIEPAEPEGR